MKKQQMQMTLNRYTGDLNIIQEASVVLRGSRGMTQWETYQSSEGFFDH